MLRLDAQVLLHHRRVRGQRCIGRGGVRGHHTDYRLRLRGAGRYIARRGSIWGTMAAGVCHSPMTPLTLDPGRLPLADLRRISTSTQMLAVNGESKAAVDAAAETVNARARRWTYGLRRQHRIRPSRAHADRRGATRRTAARARAVALAPAPARCSTTPSCGLIVALKAASLARGHSGVRWEVDRALRAIANAGIVPCIPSQGSVGASGDLAPLAHLAAVLIGEGEVRRSGGRTMSGARRAARRRDSRRSCSRRRKVSRSSTARRFRPRSRSPGSSPPSAPLAAAFVAGALSVDACLGSDTPFDARIQALRGHRGQTRRRRDLPRSARRAARIRASHLDCPRVQDPVQPALPAAGDGRVPRPDAPRGAGAASPRRTPCRTIRWYLPTRARSSVGRQLPRRAGRVRGGQPRARHRRDRRAVGAAHRAADGHATCRACRRSWSRTAASTPAS